MSPGRIADSIFKAYDIRGVYPEQINEDAAWKIGNAAARFLRGILSGYERSKASARSVCVGRDMRTHSESLATALTNGMLAAGVNVIDLGMIDTPQIYFAINHLGTCGGVQVTASHNPEKYNGFKISGVHARPIGGNTGLKDIQHIASALIHTRGMISGSLDRVCLTREYKDHVRKFLKPGLRPVKIAIDASNGMAGKMIPEVFGDLPIKIIPLNFEHTGSFNHDPNPLIEENLAQLKTEVKKSRCKFGVCFDGDGDRLVVVDEKGGTVACDLLTALLAQYFLKSEPDSTVVYDLRSSRIVAEQILKAGGTPRRERVGHAFMKKTMHDSHAVFGGELSGHFYYRDNYNADSGLITLVHLLNIVCRSGKSMSKIIAPLKKYHSSGEINFQVEDKQAGMDGLVAAFKDGKVDRLDGVTVEYKDWWFNCRPSNTEPLLRLNVEASSKELLSKKLTAIETHLGKPV